MAFNIKVYAGTAATVNDLFTKLVTAFTTVYGEDTTITPTFDGWSVTEIDTNARYWLNSTGENGLDDINYILELVDGKIVITGVQYYDKDGSGVAATPDSYSTRGIPDYYYSKKELVLPMNNAQFWIYGNKDFIHIITRGYGSTSYASYLTPHIFSFGKYIPTYNPTITTPAGVTEITQGSDIVIPVQDASIFEPDRYAIISGPETWEKVLVVEVDLANNMIRVSNIAQHHKQLQTTTGANTLTHPIIIGEISKPYYMWKQAAVGASGYGQGAINESFVSMLSDISGTISSKSATAYADQAGDGVCGTVFQPIATLAKHSAIDMLNYDRYMFELYIYVDEEQDDKNKGFYGKLPFIYAVGSSDTNSETTVINDNYYLYRVFDLYSFLDDESIAVRETYK